MVGRPKTHDSATAGQLQKERAAAHSATISRGVRDIAPGFTLDTIDWDRRLRAKADPFFFAETYIPAVFYLPPADDHIRIVAKAKTIFQSAGKMALAMPRGQGKTAWCRALILWGTLFGFKLFPFFIGPSESAAKKTLHAIKSFLFNGRKLREDFPETIYPIVKLENRSAKAKGQIFDNFPTHIDWGPTSIRYPCLPLTEEQRDVFLKHDESAILRTREGNVVCQDGRYFAATSGIIVRAVGIEGSIRGDADTHPITLAQPRPDLALLDDVQKDSDSKNPAVCQKIIDLIDGAIEGLSAPDEPMACLMPCTVTHEGDVSDTFLDRGKRPEWGGERCSMVTNWPEGLDNYTIDPDSESGKLWLKYHEKYRESFRINGDFRLATKFYKQNRDTMDAGFEVSWEERYNKAAKFAGLRELSAIQKAMNYKLSNVDGFVAEYQNRPRNRDAMTLLLKPVDLALRISPTERAILPAYTTHLTAFVDVQNEFMAYQVFACAPDFTGVIVDYGTWPRVDTKYYQRDQINDWGTLSRAFFEAYPAMRKKAKSTAKGKLRAPFEAKIYFGVTECVKMLLSRRFQRIDKDASVMMVERIGVDVRWGKAVDYAKRAIADIADPKVIPTRGFPLPPSHKQLEQYRWEPGFYFEHQKHLGLEKPKWVWRADPGGTFYLMMDANRLKTFAMSRLTCPVGMPGAVTLHKGTPEDHQLISEHIAGSEFPDTMEARGNKKEMWYERDGTPDNEGLDCFYGNLALASLQGARVNEGQGDRPVPPKKKTMAETYAARKAATR